MFINRYVRELIIGKYKREIDSKAIATLKDATEAYLVSVFEDANLCAAQCKRQTIIREDIRLARRIRKEY